MAYTKYLGETDAKRVARFQMATFIKKLSMISPLPKGRVVTLCGNIAGDVGCFKHILKFKPEDVIFVERNRDHRHGLTRAKKLWPGVETYFGNVEDVLKPGTISFFNADCMGRFTYHSPTFSVLQAAAAGMMKDGALSFTYFRSRDQKNEKPFGNSMVLKKNPGESWDELAKRRQNARAAMYAMAVMKMLGFNSTLVKAMSYDSRHSPGAERHSPMGMLLFKNTPFFKISLHPVRWWEEVLNSYHIPTDSTAEKLRNAVVSLIHRGHDTHTIAEIFNLDEPRIRAWRAHETRGTYN